MEQQQQKLSSFTFNVDKVELNKDTSRGVNVESVLKLQGINIANSEDFSHKNNTEKKFIGGRVPGFFSAIHFAYAEHYALKLSVSDFIILIGQGLARHIRQNAEKLRHHFVNHEGKQRIEIRRDEFVKGQKNDWSTVFGNFAEEIKKNMKADVHDIIIDNTSVATPMTKIVSEITLMDAVKSFLDFRMMTLCGIPQITLEGTPDDWKKLKEKVAKLVEMNKDDCLDLNWWLNELLPVVEKICEAGIHRKIDIDFWSKIYKCTGRSGGPYITGWITKFLPYLTKNVVNDFKDTLTTDKIPNQISQVPFIWEYLGENIPMTFCGGFLGAELDKETAIVRPAYFWCVNSSNQPEKVDKNLSMMGSYV